MTVIVLGIQYQSMMISIDLDREILLSDIPELETLIVARHEVVLLVWVIVDGGDRREVLRSYFQGELLSILINLSLLFEGLVSNHYLLSIYDVC